MRGLFLHYFLTDVHFYCGALLSLKKRFLLAKCNLFYTFGLLHFLLHFQSVTFFYLRNAQH